MSNKLFLFFLFFIISLNFSANSNTIPVKYNLTNCKGDGTSFNFDVNLVANKVKAWGETEGHPLNIFLDIKSSTNYTANTRDFIFFDMLSDKRKLNKWEKIATENLVTSFNFLPKSKVVEFIVVGIPQNKTVRKALKKIYKVEYINTTIKLRCDDLYVSKSKEIKKIEKKTETVKKSKKPITDKIIPVASGTGFFISNTGHIITNHHVINECNYSNINYKNEELTARLIASDKANDLSLLKIDYKIDSPLPISDQDIFLLEEVIVAGFPLGKKISTSISAHKGVVTRLSGFGDNYSNFQTDADINKGNSGGPILNQKGNVVGVAVAKWQEEGVQGLNFGIKSSTLRSFISANDVFLLKDNKEDLSNRELAKLITAATVYIECFMTETKIRAMLSEKKHQKALYSNLSIN